ncbi:MAG: AAA family ATPase [Prolixibacteraceae bacterium]|nr:AAA family ATPase [Prolixibacteraceae bacterium]
MTEISNDKDYLFLDADAPSARSLLQNPTTEQIRTFLGDYKYVFLDEAQRISEICLTLKMITDKFKDVQLFVSGFSSFDLGNALNKPLTGRK